MTIDSESESLSFAAHSRKAAAAPREMLDYVETYLEKRGECKEGREMSAANWNALKEVHDQYMAILERHTALCARMRILLDRTMSAEAARAKIAEILMTTNPSLDFQTFRR